MKIEELLDAATPRTAEPPTSASIATSIHDQRRRQRRLRLTVFGCVAIAGGLALSLPRDHQHVDAVLDMPSTSAQNDETPRATTPTSTPTASATDQAPSPLDDRWFLVPSDEQELQHLQDHHLSWSLAQSNYHSDVGTVARPTIADGAVLVYHLDDTGIEITAGPEEFNETFQDIAADGSTIRVGSDTSTGSVKAFRSWEPGVIAVVGWGLTEDEAVQIALSATSLEGEVQLDQSLLPRDLVFTPTDVPAPGSYETSVTWSTNSGVQIALQTAPGTLTEAALDVSPAIARRTIDVRGSAGIFAPAASGQDPARLMWAEGGYQFTLTATDTDSNLGSGELVEIADALVRTDQAKLATRLASPFMIDQATTVAGWLQDDPLPPGWDAGVLINAVPGSRHEVAASTRQYVSCAWGAEWLEAAQTGDVERRGDALDALSHRADWSTAAVETQFWEELHGTKSAEKAVTQQAQSFDAELDLLVQAHTPAEVAALGLEVGCGFTMPSTR